MFKKLLNVRSLSPLHFPNSSNHQTDDSANVVHKPKVYNSAVYYSNWSIYERKHLPLDIDYSIVDHVYYAFLLIDKVSGKLAFLDTWADLEIPLDSPLTDGTKVHGLVNLFRDLKKLHPKLSISFSIGGWGTDDMFQAIAHNKLIMVNFAKSCGEFIRNYGFDGIDIDWEYPKTITEGSQFIEILRLVRNELDQIKPGLLLSIAAPASDCHIKNLKIKEMNDYLDHWNLMCYDYTGAGWSDKIGFHSNLNGHNGDNELNTDSVVNHYISNGAKPSKIIIGMPLYGRKFEGCEKLDIGSKFDKSKTTDEGIIDYKKLPLAGTTEFFDHRRVAAYCHDMKTNTLVVYDCPRCAIEKAKFIKKHNLGGGMFWDSAGESTERSLIKEFVKELKSLS